MLLRADVRLPPSRVVTSQHKIDLHGELTWVSLDVGATLTFSNKDIIKYIYLDNVGSTIIKRMFVEIADPTRLVYPVSIKIIDSNCQSTVLLYQTSVHEIVKQHSTDDILRTLFVKSLVKDICIEELHPFRDILDLSAYERVYNDALTDNDAVSPFPDHQLLIDPLYSYLDWDIPTEIRSVSDKTLDTIPYICSNLLYSMCSYESRTNQYPIWEIMDALLEPYLPYLYTSIAYDKVTTRHMRDGEIHRPTKSCVSPIYDYKYTPIQEYTQDILNLTTYIQSLPILSGTIVYRNRSTEVEVFNINMMIGKSIDKVLIHSDLTSILHFLDIRILEACIHYLYTEDLLLDITYIDGTTSYLSVDLVLANMLSQSFTHNLHGNFLELH